MTAAAPNGAPDPDAWLDAAMFALTVLAVLALMIVINKALG